MALAAAAALSVNPNAADRKEPAVKGNHVGNLATSAINGTFARVDSVMNVHAGDDSGKNQTAAAAAASVPGYGTSILNGTYSVKGDGDVRVVELHEWKAAAASLAEAFAVDHTSRYFLDTPDRAHWTEEQKWELHVKIMEYITYAHLLKGLVVTAGPNYACVALWMPPRANMDDLPTIVRSGMWRLNYQLSLEGRKRFFTEFLPLLHDTKLSILGPDHDLDSWYLVYLGTRPTGRGKGYARKVMEFVTLGKADPEGRKCYLESSADVNRVIYGKMGFEVRKKIYLQREVVENVELDIMVREPVNVKAAREGGIVRID